VINKSKLCLNCNSHDAVNSWNHLLNLLYCEYSVWLSKKLAIPFFLYIKRKKTISSLTCYLKYRFRNIIDTHTIILLACVTSVVSAQLRPPLLREKYPYSDDDVTSGLHCWRHRQPMAGNLTRFRVTMTSSPGHPSVRPGHTCYAGRFESFFYQQLRSRTSHLDPRSFCTANSTNPPVCTSKEL